MKEGDFFSLLTQTDFKQKLDAWMMDYHKSVQQLDFGNEGKKMDA